MKPEIATILDDGTYGQREMTDDEYAQYQQLVEDYKATEETIEE